MLTPKSLCRLTLGTLALAALTGAAQAAPLPAAPSVTVSYRDLDMNTEAGAQQLYQRIRGAARSVCGEAGRSLLEQMQWKSCVRGSTTAAVTSVHSPLLSELDAGASGAQHKMTQRR
jgi:UrcA family protein